MDPLTVIGIVANVVQLLDAGSNAINLCHQIYKAGVSADDSQMIATSEQLHKCYSALSNSISGNGISDPKILKGGTLNSFAVQCCETAKELHAELDSLRRPAGRGLHKTLFTAARRGLKSGKIDRLKKRLDEYQKVLDTEILVNVKYAH